MPMFLRKKRKENLPSDSIIRIHSGINPNLIKDFEDENAIQNNSKEDKMLKQVKITNSLPNSSEHHDIGFGYEIEL